MKDQITISGVMLRRSSDYAIVEVEYNGVWREVIREFVESPFSHIVEPSGMRDAPLSELQQMSAK